MKAAKTIDGIGVLAVKRQNSVCDPQTGMAPKKGTCQYVKHYGIRKAFFCNIL